jgi:hypothetical protein
MGTLLNSLAYVFPLLWVPCSTHLLVSFPYYGYSAPQPYFYPPLRTLLTTHTYILPLLWEFCSVSPTYPLPTRSILLLSPTNILHLFWVICSARLLISSFYYGYFSPLPLLVGTMLHSPTMGTLLHSSARILPVLWILCSTTLLIFTPAYSAHHPYLLIYFPYYENSAPCPLLIPLPTRSILLLSLLISSPCSE